MCDMGVSHDQRVIADPCNSAALDRAAVDGHALADFVVIADFKTRGFSPVAQVLRSEPDGGEGEEFVVGADFCGAFDGDIRDQFAVFFHLDIRTYGAEGADFARRVNLCVGTGDGGGVNDHWLVKLTAGAEAPGLLGNLAARLKPCLPKFKTFSRQRAQGSTEVPGFNSL